MFSVSILFEKGDALGQGGVIGHLLNGKHDLLVTSLSTPLYLLESHFHVCKAVIHALLQRFDTRLELAQFGKKILNDRTAMVGSDQSLLLESGNPKHNPCQAD